MTVKTGGLAWLRKRGVLLLLFVAFLLTSCLVFEQQQTIESQRALIRDLFRDSMELSQLKIRQASLKH
jgi:hypothetical protein